MTVKEIHAEMKEFLGVVPEFFKLVPDEYLEMEWGIFKQSYMSETAPQKHMALIGLACAGVSKGHHATHYYTKMAEVMGATEEEINAISYFAKWSIGWNVYLDGVQWDPESHGSEFSKAVEGLKKNKDSINSLPDISDTASRDEVESQIKSIFGTVPTPYQKMPDDVLPTQWKLHVKLWYGEGTIPVKVRHLAGLCIASIMKSKAAIKLHTEIAKIYGATHEEIEAAVRDTMLTAGWSTYVSTMQLDFDDFRKDVKHMTKHMKSAVPAG